MARTPRSRTARMTVALAYALGLLTPLFAWTDEQKRREDPTYWEETIQTFEEKDRESPPPKGGVQFIGSSSIRNWDLEKWFPGKGYINRGFGGSHIEDSTYYAKRIVLPYEPKTIVLYAGDNDINAGKSPRRVFDDYRAFVAKVHATLPKTRIIYIAIKPSIDRWTLVDNMRQANRMIRAETEKDKRLDFVDIDTPMIGDDGTPRAELFADDGLHLNDMGYELWTGLVKTCLGDGE